MKKLNLLILLFISFFTANIFGQKAVNRNLTISGVVLDNYGNPLPGVSIFIKNSPGVGTVSDVDGKFMIKAAKEKQLFFR